MRLRNIAAAAVVGMSLLFAAGCETEKAPVKKVASIDESVIYQMDMFVKANEDLNKWAEETSKKKQEEVKDKSDEEKAKAFQEYQAELDIKTNETLNPLKEKARAAVANAAKNKDVTVVLDKKIVVYGVPDITDEVKALLESGGELTYPEENAEELKVAPIGYFDQNIVSSLKVFKEAEMELFQERNAMLQKMREELQKAEQAGKQPSPAEIQAMQKAIEARLESLQQQKLTPLLKAVNDSVEEVAEQEGLSLVLDTQHVMYGGRNLTEMVVDTFLKKVSEGNSASAEPVAAASPAASPVPTEQ
ncbi:MAG: OmpH family outer membrane protein [Vulcanimicrobiota bacterium]